MTKLRGIRRLLLGIALIAVAAFAAFYLKDLLDRGNPDNAIPRLTIEAGGQTVDVPPVGYSWTFAFGSKMEKDAASVQQMFEGAMPRVELQGGEAFALDFSQKSDVVLVDRSFEPYTYEFQPADNERTVPYEPGSYIYVVSATFASGEARYYFNIIVL